MAKADILIVEDSYIVAFHLQSTLEREGYRVVGTEASGENALAYLETARADVVLMDIMLSGELDGIETARAVQMKHNIPVIYITALTDKETIQRAKITEPFGYLTKPFEDRELFTVIEMALYKHQIDRKLRRSEEKFHSTVTSISDGVIIIDEQFSVTFMNPSAEVATGWSLQDAQGRDIFTVFSLKDRESEQFPVNPFQNTLGYGKINSLPENLALVSRRGTEHPVGEGNMSPVFNDRGKFMGMVIIFKDLSERVLHERVVKEYEKKHLAALLEGQEQERSRIAKDLHDGLGQMLNAIKMNIAILGKNNERVNVLSELVDDAIQESVRISENLLPSKLMDFDLATCLNSLCNIISKTSPTPVVFESLTPGSFLEQSQKINLYRIAQEAINNAIKHAHASVISVLLNEEEETVKLMVEDDGKGFARMHPADQPGHHGLANMRERAEIMGGKLTIESDADRGTLVIVEAPIHNKKQIYAQA